MEPAAYPVYLLILVVRGEVGEAPLGEGVVVEDHVAVRRLTVQLPPGRSREEVAAPPGHQTGQPSQTTGRGVHP